MWRERGSFVAVPILFVKRHPLFQPCLVQTLQRPKVAQRSLSRPIGRACRFHPRPVELLGAVPGRMSVLLITNTRKASYLIINGCYDSAGCKACAAVQLRRRNSVGAGPVSGWLFARHRFRRDGGGYPHGGMPSFRGFISGYSTYITNIPPKPDMANWATL